MAIDTRTNRADKSNRNKYYKKDYVNNMKLERDAVVQGVFYSKDVEPFSSISVSSGNVMRRQVTGAIETEDVVDDLEENDYVLYNGSIWLVTGIEVVDNDNEKWYSNSPSKTTKIRLRK